LYEWGLLLRTGGSKRQALDGSGKNGGELAASYPFKVKTSRLAGPLRGRLTTNPRQQFFDNSMMTFIVVPTLGASRPWIRKIDEEYVTWAAGMRQGAI
jgi:hypothetical protein